MKENSRILWDETGLEAAVAEERPILMIDILRATTTIVTAFAMGATAVSVVDEDLDTGEGMIRIGEKEGIKLEGFDYDNSPSTISSIDLSGKEVLLKTTNFSKAYVKAKRTRVYAGSFLNLSACIKLVSSTDSLEIYPCRRRGRIALEDLFAALIIVSGEVPAVDVLFELVEGGASAKNLISLGKEDDIEFACRIDQFDILPVSEPGGSCFRLGSVG